MLKKLLVSFVFLLSAQAWGATRYICQTGLGAQDGTSAANCYNGYAAAWTAAQITAGDTVYIVGDITSATNTIGASGTAGSPIVFDCLPPGQSSPGTLKTSSTGPVFLSDDKEYITVQNCKFAGNSSNLNQTYALRFVTRSATRTGISVIGNEMSNEYTTSASVHPCLGLDTDNVATHRFVDVTVRNNTFHECGIGAPTQNSDGATLNAVTSGLIVRDNIAWGNNSDGLDIPGGGAIIVERNLLYANGFDGMKIHCGSTAISGGKITGNISFGNAVYGFTMQDFANTLVANNVVSQYLTSITPFGGTPNLNSVIIQAVNTGTCTQSGNTYANNHFQAEYSNGVIRVASVAKAAFESGNTWDGNNIRKMGSGSTVIDFTSDSGNNVTTSNFATWQGTHTRDLRSDPLWVGGTSPSTAEGFRLTSASPLRRAGTDLNIGNVQDNGTRAFSHPPSIGAWEVTSGDSASSRTTASTRTVRN